VMSAGTGILHSEFNPSDKEPVNLLQIWIYPKEKNIKPRYAQKYYSPEERKNKFQTVVSGIDKNGALYIHQDAVISIVNLEAEKEIIYMLKKSGNGIYLFVIEGEGYVEGVQLFKRDAIGIVETDQTLIKAGKNTTLLIIETLLL